MVEREVGLKAPIKGAWILLFGSSLELASWFLELKSLLSLRRPF
jgi:hypothetical protein